MIIRNLFPKYKLKHHKGEFGLEIETETLTGDAYPKMFFELVGDVPHGGTSIKKYNVPITNFTAYSDNSLRNFGREFVFDHPLTFSEAVASLLEFDEKTKGVAFIPEAPGTSVHVHVNFSESTLKTLLNFITTWTICENILIEYCGPTRRSNLFARPIRTCEGQLSYIKTLIDRVKEGHEKALTFSEGEVKYAALNIAPLSTLGTLEIRCMRGTTDVNQIIEWLSIIKKIKEYSERNITPKDIVNQATFDLDFLDDVFGIYDEVLDTEHTEALLVRNLYYGMRIAERADWKTFGDAIVKKNEAAAKKSEAAIKTIGQLLAEDSQIASQLLTGGNPTLMIYDDVIQDVVPTPVGWDIEEDPDIELDEPPLGYDEDDQPEVEEGPW